MEEELISFETAKLAKEKGFNIQTRKAFDVRIFQPSCVFEDNIEEVTNTFIDGCASTDIRYFRPTQSFLQKWLREMHKIYIEVNTGSDIEFSVTYGTIENTKWLKTEIENTYFNNLEGDLIFFKTYEEALEAGLQEVLKLI